MHNSSRLADPGIIPDPYPVYAELAEREPVHWCDGLNAWAVLRYADCAGALTDSRLTAERMEEVLRVKFDGRSVPPGNIYHRFTKNVMMYTDPPLHDSLRRSTHPAFSRAAHDHYGEVIRRVTADLVATVPRRATEIDAVSELALRLPVRTSVHAFGVPEEDLDFVVPRVNALMTYWSGPRDQPMEFDRLLEHLTELHTYARELIRGGRGRVLPDTVIARLAAAQEDAEATFEQTTHQLVLLLIALYAPTTPGSASSGMLSFARNQQQIGRFLSERACADNAVNEVVRYNASNQFTWRVAKEDLEIGGVRIEKGRCVALFLGAANRDHRVFPRPDAFDLGRANSGRNLSFGSGPHSCLGRQIAGLQLKWFFTALFARFPKIRLAGEPEWHRNLEFRSLRFLPLGLG
ncbi:4-nitrotryptophan synthase [Actinoallomurus iriomotensis]|uniref:Cytochrome P-450 like protein n=1 Tax=Actinoallomurus iriomotensis TaxID=478107 RepID=A0A9W6W489_9ACTN|nr:4-nitrotryptophan synthase [Actinoallomurus iriomotensis]GLY90755.1 cytochrome P-450 like protein [Actinoallomurus iriomotensis]